MDNLLFEDICMTIDNNVKIKLRENKKWYGIFLGFDKYDYEEKDIIIGINKGKGNFVYFTKDSNVDEYDYILEKILNYGCNRYIENKIKNYFNNKGMEIIVSEVNKND